ncbi:MAG TPA: cytochrome c [Gemmatimonadaceae bacterium]|nr:cytochrome c [Gemmatimonadaceae bacterium]
MSIKRRIEFPVSSSVWLLGRVLLIGSALGFATACSHRGASKSDSTVASADTAAATSAAPAVAQASPVESLSTGETTLASDAKAKGTAAPAPAPANTPAPVVHHVVHERRADTTKTPAAATPATTPTAAPATAPTTAVAAAPAGSTTVKADTGNSDDHLLVTPQVYEGWKMFAVYCYRCHGVDAMGGAFAPNLRKSVISEGSVTHDVFVTTVTYGRTALGMPTWRGLLSPEQIEDLWLYVNARSSGKLAPGRPHKAADNTQ